MSYWGNWAEEEAKKKNALLEEVSDPEYRSFLDNFFADDIEKGVFKSNTWRVGGQGGGSCWDTSDDPARYYSISADPEPEWEALESLLDKICPSMTRRQYKSLMDISSIGEDGVNEYYDNYTDYNYRVIKLRDFYDFLKENSLI